MAADPYVILCEANPQVCSTFATQPFEEPIQCAFDHLSSYGMAATEATPPENTLTLFLHPRYHKVAGLDRFVEGLTLLQLIRCRITNLHEIGRAAALRFLWLDDNKILNIKALGSLPRLEYLSLSDNSLTDKALAELRSTSIRGLNVANNPIFYTTWLANYPNLVHLDISRTNVSNFNILPILCPKLHSVDISATQLYNFISLLNMLQGSFPMLRSIHTESRAGCTPLFELMTPSEMEQFFSYLIVTYDLQLRVINGVKYTASDIVKNYILCNSVPSVRNFRLCSLMLTMDLNQFIHACDAYTQPLLRAIYQGYEQIKCDLLDIRLLFLCKEHIKDYISTAEAENTEELQKTSFDLHKLGFVEMNNVTQSLAAVLSLLRRLYLRYCEIIGLSFGRIKPTTISTELLDEMFPTQRAQLEEKVSGSTVFTTLFTNDIVGAYFTRRKYQALEITERCIAPTLQYLEEVSVTNRDPLMYVLMSDIFDCRNGEVYRDTAFPLNLFALIHEIIGANIICASNKILNLNFVHRSAIVKAEATEETNEKITEVLTEDLYRNYFRSIEDDSQKLSHPFNIRSGLRRIPLYNESELHDIFNARRPGEPLVLIGVKLSSQTIAMVENKPYLDINTTVYTIVGNTILLSGTPAPKLAHPSRAERLAKVKIQCSNGKATKHTIPLISSSHDPLLRWLLSLIWQKYKAHIDALSNVIPDSIFADCSNGGARTSGGKSSSATQKFVPLIDLIAHQGETTLERIAVERGAITLQQPASSALRVDLHNCGLTDKQLQDYPAFLANYTSARHISLACNLLTTVSLSLECLNYLDLSSNSLKDFFVDCPNLVFLDISSNNIAHISDFLRGMSAATRQNLRHIVVFDNPFTMVSSINMYYSLHIIGFLPNLQSINGRMIKPLISRGALANNPAMLCEVFNPFVESKALTSSITLLDDSCDENPPWMTKQYNLLAPSDEAPHNPNEGVSRTYFELSPVILGDFINYSMIGAFDIPKTLPDTLTSVDLSYNFVVKPSNLLSYSSIRVLDISNCKITSKILDLLTQTLKCLTELNISCNNVISINSLAQYSSTLTTLHANYNPGLEIETLPELPSLRTISCLGIKSTAEQVAVTLSNRCANCTYVVLPYAESVPGIVYMLPLQSLNCVPVDPSLVRQNRLKLVGSLNQEIVTSINAWSGKGTLSFANSGIMTLAFEKSLTDIVNSTETIFASGNAIMNITALKDFPSLIQIDLSYNRITDPFNGLKSNTLEALNLSFNPLTSIKITNTMLPCLKCLILRGCNISALPNNAFTAIGRVLTYLDIGENQLITVSKECFSGLVKLKTLKCDLCNLRNVEFLEPLSSYGTLLLLNIRGNKIHNGDKTIDTLKKLRSITKLFVADNPFSTREKNIAEFRVKLFYAMENLVELEGIAKSAEEVSRLEQYIQWRLEKDAKNEVQIVRFTIGDAAHSSSQPALPLFKNSASQGSVKYPQSTDRPSLGAIRKPSSRTGSKPSLNGIMITGVTRQSAQ